MAKKYWLVSMFFFGINATPLFDRYKDLQNVIPHVQLANLPTPVHRLHALEKFVGHATLFIKRDDLTGLEGCYGGNKVRKLEFLLGDAMRKKARTIITYGCVGTNHGLATAWYAKQLGLDCLLMVKHQPNSPIVRQNLLLDYYCGAEITVFKNDEERAHALEIIMACTDDAYFFPTGGSVPLGALGYVNAAFELKEQIDAGALPEPDFIYIPVSSAGTVAGLLLGFQLTGIFSKIIAVGIEPEEVPDEFYHKTKTLFLSTNNLLHEACAHISLYSFPEDQLMINNNFCGTEYGLWINEGDEAMQIMKEAETITLEGTYSAKALAALIADSKNGVLQKDDVVLFWNTYCGLDFSALTSQVDYKNLPQEVHRYFEDV